MSRIFARASASAGLAITLGGAAGPVSGQDKEALVVARRDHMKAQTAAISTIKAYLRGEADQATALKSAEDLVKLVNSIPSNFPAGTSSADFPGLSGAAPTI